MKSNLAIITKHIMALKFYQSSIAILFLALNAKAADLYVRTDGSDSMCNGQANASSISAPNCAYASIQKSINSAMGGDTVNIQPGTYNGNLIFSRSGSSNSEIVFRGPSAVIRGNVRTSGSYLVLDGLTISPPTAGGWGALIIAGQYNTVKNCAVTNYGASAGDQATAIILENGSAFNTVESCTIQDLNDIDVFHINGHDHRIRNNKINNINSINYVANHTDIFQTWGWTGSASYNILIEGNKVTNSNCQLGNITTDDNPQQRDWIFRNNIFANVGAALFSGIPKTKYYNNIFYNVGRAQGYAVSLYTQRYYSSVGNEFVNNVFIGPDSGVDLHSGSRSDVVLFTNNYFAQTNFSAKPTSEWMGAQFINGGDPGFVNIGVYDFHLKSSSLLINRGRALAGFTTDFDGRTRDSLWDIGAFEHSGALPSPDPTPAPAPAGVISNSNWNNTAFGVQTGKFQAVYDVVPNASRIDALTGLSNGAATGYSSLAVIVRFNESGVIDARNGGSYAASSVMNYVAGRSYRVRIVVDVMARNYDVFVTPSAASEVQLAKAFAFRSEQALVVQLNNRAVQSSIGTQTLSNFTVTTLGDSVKSKPAQSLMSSLTPASLRNSDGANVNYELGMRFRSNVAGKITHIRFFKSSSESGVHVGKIYSSAGAVLAQVTFSGESGSGWQQMALATPLSIAAETEYTVTVNTGNTYYVITTGGMASQLSSGNLRSVVGNNGVYGPVGRKPTSTWNNSNYFRDVIFVPN